MKQKIVVGLTGTFGSGKSTVGRLFRSFGAKKVISTDRIAHEVFRPRHSVGGRIKKLFNVRGKLTRKRIAKEVFGDRRKRKRLEAVVHPYVKKRVREKLSCVLKGTVVVEVPLLFETKFDRLCDTTVAVTASVQTAVKRSRRLGLTSVEVRSRLGAQWSGARKKQKADFWIHNSGSKSRLRQKAKRVWNLLNAIKS